MALNIKKRFKTLALVVASLGLLCVLPGFIYLMVSFAVGGGDRTFWGEAHEAVSESNKVLVKHGLCSSESDCATKSYVFRTVYPKGYKIIVYGITDQAILGDIAQAASRPFYKKLEMKNIVIAAYGFKKHKDYVFPFPPIPFTRWKEGTVLDLRLERE